MGLCVGKVIVERWMKRNGMSLILKNNLLYLHIPKTGGNWLTKIMRSHGCVLREIESKHATYDLVSGRLRARSFIQRKLTLRGIENMKYMAVVRNPLKWYESWFKYQTSNGFRDWGEAGNPLLWHVMSSINLAKQRDFNEFVLAINREHPGFVTSLYAAYTARSSAIVLKNENIREDFARINSRFELGVSEAAIFESEEHGVSPKLPIVWDQKVLDEILSLEQACFRTYDYDWRDTVTVR